MNIDVRRISTEVISMTRRLAELLRCSLHLSDELRKEIEL